MNLSCAPPPPAPPAERAAGHRRLAEPLYVLAYIGAHVGFMPLLVLLLPRRVASMAASGAAGAATAGGGDHLLSILLLAGGITASLANIAAGHVSDGAIRARGSRRRVIALGLVWLLACYGWLALARSGGALAVGVIGFQLAVNLLFAPVGALIADYIPDGRKGRVAGLLNCALPVANSSVALIAWVAPDDGAGGFVATAVLIGLCVAPLLVAWPFAPARPPAPPQAQRPEAPRAPPPAPAARLPQRNFALAWGARFLLQLGAVLLTNYLYPYLAALLRGPLAGSRDAVGAAVGGLWLWAGLAACGGALAAGRFSDHMAARRADRRPLMIAAALLAGLALVGLALVGRGALAPAAGWPVLMAAYAGFHLSLAGFFAVEAAYVAEMVSHSRRRGQLLGYMNLANTLPAIVTSALALGATRHAPLDAAMPLILAGCALACAGAAAMAAALSPRPR